ncbi:MAG: hypothetical protein QM212_04045 [Bacteroidota bacterium]|jgi:hypothetical protein|nr:hypothetical protein [Bacteroidales bacterium]MDI9535133.1 hypothetical protein [Bacteroidota bacterium]OQC46223.1 MAG: hypothetical protein BWX59_00600 [Bacteroidetes bacterium ADurb.Bin028]NLP19512.1 hypothetical protein [Bacteroidales bacterium]HNY44252.1 hypothetical protein [Bacteroidales bacterium]
MYISTSEQHIEFLKNTVLKGVENAFENNQLIFGFMSLAQAIEILGAYLDDKPLRAKKQSLKRFSLAINRLFPKEYSKANDKNFLYYQLRACMTHFFIPTSRLSLNLGRDNKEKPHLSVIDGVMLIYHENLLTDFRFAVSILEKRILEGKLKLKPISFGKVND